MRLFVALVPDAAVTAAVDAARCPPRCPAPGWRAVAPARRHVTLRFLADADPAATAGALRRDLAGLPAPTLHTAGAGVFGTALWLGRSSPADPAGWARLLRAAGADPDSHVAHLTVARGRGRPTVPADLAGHRGPSWTPGEVRARRERDAVPGRGAVPAGGRGCPTGRGDGRPRHRRTPRVDWS